MVSSLGAELCLPAPAKLNLFLHLTGRRSDGYHELQTLFQLLDYGDELAFRRAPRGSIHVEMDPAVPGLSEADNIVYRVARALAARYPDAGGVSIRVRKRLPAGGGLGGGSSDAATTLVGLNRLWGLGLDIAALCALGLELGADVPVFVRGQTAWGEGIGERLTPVSLPPAWYLIVNPGCAVSTARVFAHPQLTRDTRPMKIRAFFGEGAGNDCAAVVENLYPEVRAARRWLDRHAQARLTGTGGCLFARFASRDRAATVLAQVPEPWTGFVAQGVNLSPLIAAGGFASQK